VLTRESPSAARVSSAFNTQLASLVAVSTQAEGCEGRAEQRGGLCDRRGRDLRE
jgi:hypothetical protein